MIVGVGVVSGGIFDVSNILKLVFVFGDFKCIGLMIYKEFQGVFECDCVFVCCFQKIDIVELIVEEMVKILCGLKEQYEEYYGIIYMAAALRLAVELSHKYINDRFLLDKVIDVIDEVGVVICLQPEFKCQKSVCFKDIEVVIFKIVWIFLCSVFILDCD